MITSDLGGPVFYFSPVSQREVRDVARPEKEAMVAELQEKLSSAQGVVLTDYRGLNVKAMTELRKKLREAGVEFRVVKNTLTGLAAKGAKIEGLSQFLTGPTAVAFGLKDPVIPAKILVDFAKDHKELKIKVGILAGQVIDAERVEALAKLPSREELLAQVARGFQAPIAGLVNVLQGTLRSLVYALDAVRRQKEAQPAVSE